MAVMIPSKPLDTERRSGEEEIFYKLKKALPQDVYVAHSFEIFDVDNQTGNTYESEIDFLIIIPNVGCLIVESKNACIFCETGEGLEFNNKTVDYLWHLPNGEIMKYNGPFRQAERSMRNFSKFLSEGRASKFGFNKKITFSRCVLLPLIDQGTINKWNLPADAGSIKFILSKDDIDSKVDGFLYRRIVEIIKMQKTNDYRCMNDDECKAFIQSVIAPSCNLLPSVNFFINLQNERLDSFLHQQLVILDFMDEQKVAVIGGGAGTGKTKIALEKARRLSEKGKQVLFLCFNKKLKEHLMTGYNFPGVKYETLDSLFFSYFGSDSRGNYNPLKAKIEKEYEKGSFLYKNFIIDEAQDFGRNDIEGSGLLNLFKDIADLEDDGSCYFFYDKYQLVQSRKVPNVILNADCKMTLYKNCRNTEKIAKTSYKVFRKDELSKRDVKGFEIGVNPKALNCPINETYETLKKMVLSLKSKGYKEIVILTTKEEGGSALSNKAKGDFLFFDSFKCFFTTCRKFKGLESEAVIIVDVDATTLLNRDNRLLFYVGTSRAKFDLNIIFNLSEDECKTLIKESGTKFPFYNSDLIYTVFETEKFRG